MVVKIDRKWEEIQIEQLEVVFDIACIQKVSRHTLHLCSVENGCVQMTLLVPSDTEWESFKSSETVSIELRSFLSRMGLEMEGRTTK